MNLEEQVVHRLQAKRLTISTAESCTGGLIAATLVNVSGVSNVFNEGYITYSNEAKKRLVNVSEETLQTYGAVSKQTAIEMAKGCMLVSDSDVGIASTGIAGPDGGTKDHPVGLIYIACYYHSTAVVKELRLNEGRNENRMQTVTEALQLILDTIPA